MTEPAGPTTEPPMNPDCTQGKHRACSGDAWNERDDMLDGCACGCHEPDGADR